MKREHLEMLHKHFRAKWKIPKRKWSEEFESVHVNDLCVEYRDSGFSELRGWYINDDTYHVFHKFPSEKSAQDALEYIRNTEILFL